MRTSKIEPLILTLLLDRRTQGATLEDIYAYLAEYGDFSKSATGTAAMLLFDRGYAARRFEYTLRQVRSRTGATTYPQPVRAHRYFLPGFKPADAEMAPKR